MENRVQKAGTVCQEDATESRASRGETETRKISTEEGIRHFNKVIFDVRENDLLKVKQFFPSILIGRLVA